MEKRHLRRSTGTRLITGDNIISLLQNKCFPFSQVPSSAPCNISAHTERMRNQDANIGGSVQSWQETAICSELFCGICMCNPVDQEALAFSELGQRVLFSCSHGSASFLAPGFPPRRSGGPCPALVLASSHALLHPLGARPSCGEVLRA